MYNYVDIAIAVIALLMMIEGWIKGLVRSVVGIVGYIAAFIIAKFYYVSTADWLLENVKWFGELKMNMSEAILASFNGNAQLQSAINTGYSTDLSEALKSEAVLSQLNLPLDISDKVASFAGSVDIAATQQNAVEGLADMISRGVLNAVSFFLIVLAVIFVVKLIGMILDAATEVPIIKQVNKLGGLMFGLVKACFFIFLIMTVITFAAPIVPQFDLIETINASQIGVYFYNNNILLLLMDIFLI